MSVWDEMYKMALEVQNPRQMSATVHGGHVASVILTKDGNYYCGLNVDTDCGLGVCAERSAIFNMLTAGEDKIDKLLSIRADGVVVPPCGACREFIRQLDPEELSAEICVTYPELEVKTIAQILPSWWGEKE